MTKKKASQRKENIGPLNSPLEGLFGAPGFANQQQQTSLPLEMAGSASYYLISLQRVMLTYAYTLYGPLRTLVDQPVYDAFRGGVKVKSDQLSPEELTVLHKKLRKSGAIKALINAMRWDRLFGGAGVIVNTDQDYKTPLNIEAITNESPLEFISADRWELAWNGIPGDEKATFLYYSKTIHQSRVLKLMGDEAPSLARQRLQGWRMSVLERVIREYNMYIKNQNVSTELMDEAKVDVYKIKGFNSAALQQAAQGKTARRLQIANQMKSFLNALIMDSEDDYIIKNQSFSGLAEMRQENRTDMAAAIGFPQSKVFGFAAKGWDAGESDLENYNAIVEAERDRAEEPLHALVAILCQHEFGFVPEDVDFEWKPLRILSAEQEENVKTQKFNRLQSLRSTGHLTAQEYMKALKEEGLFTMETEVLKGTLDPTDNMAQADESQDGEEDASGEPKGKGKAQEAAE